MNTNNLPHPPQIPLEIVVASKNKGKIGEIDYVLQTMGGACVNFALKTMNEIGIDDEIVEDGSTFEENALIKARYLFHKTGGKYTVMADDSGLAVDALNGAPGIYSARFAGVDSSDAQRNQKLLKTIHDVPFHQRTARFVCVIALISKNGNEFVARGTFDGHIAMRELGTNGFGYDPLLYLVKQKCTVAQLPAEEKNLISHRSNALSKMYEIIISNKEKFF